MRGITIDIDPRDQWLVLFREGHESSFDYYFRKWYPSVCFFAGRITGDIEVGKELASTAFMKTWAKRNKFSSSSGIRAYLFQVVRHDCFKWLKANSRERLPAEAIKIYADETAATHEEEILRCELIASVLATINELPFGSRSVISKLYIEGKNVREVAAELCLAISTVKTQKNRGLEALRRKLRPGL